MELISKGQFKLHIVQDLYSMAFNIQFGNSEMVVNSVVMVVKFRAKCHFMEEILVISFPHTD